MYFFESIFKKSSNLPTLLTLIFALLTTQVACNAQSQNSSDDRPADSEITEAISSDLVTARGVEPDMIKIATENGIVTLTGTTDDILTKLRAARIATSVKGVRSVVNEITVETDKPDSMVEKDVEDALLSDPATDKWEINSSVENGIVTISGSVDSWQEKQLVEKVVRGVDGVRGIINNVSINYAELRTEDEIKNDVRSALAWNTRIEDGLVEISVDQQTVTLSGSVGSLYEKNMAISNAYVTGVDEVNAKDLEIKSWLKDDMVRTDFLANKSDVDIKNAITSALEQHPRVEADMVTVEVENGSVTLTGTLTNLKAARAAAQVVKNTHGVQTFDNELAIANEIVVVPDMNLTDMEIKEDVLDALRIDPYVQEDSIKVSVNNGNVTLSGTTESYFKKYEADEVASTVNGVVQIDNNISVKYDELTYEPMFYDWNVIDFDYDYAPEIISDKELKASINDELLMSPFVNAANVEVSVENGVATLNGEVLSINAIQEATEEAYEGGASLVDNRLEVI